MSEDDVGEAVLLRQEIAAQHGLPPEASVFLTGTTVTEIEETASRFANLLGTTHEETPAANPDPGPGDPLADILANHHVEKHRRQRALIGALHGRPEQPRDPAGRYASFDGGARQAFPSRQAPDVEHNELVTEMALFSRAFGGGRF